MGEVTGISWTNHTFNPWIGCTKVSQGCKLCYAETQNKRYNWTDGWGKGAPRKRTSAKNWAMPLRWAAQVIKDGVIRRVFCASLADVFDAEAPQEWREDLWELITKCSNPEYFDVYGIGLEWLILTKRPENIWMMPDSWLQYPPNWIRVGVTCEDQENADRRIPILLQAWKGKNFLSIEPMIGPVDLSKISLGNGDLGDCLNHTVDRIWTDPPRVENWGKVDWVICGGESGAGCRPMDLEWARNLKAQCKAAEIPFFFKQMGGHPNKRHDPAGWPEDLRVQ